MEGSETLRDHSSHEKVMRIYVSLADSCASSGGEVPKLCPGPLQGALRGTKSRLTKTTRKLPPL